ncbi:hypothetical protein, partial [Methylobacterium crusticola]|uniref:hypothetical protein n=1 Tax=Methylobacterium crusticola TaxID=1697972 RepID=UPI001EE30253
ERQRNALIAWVFPQQSGRSAVAPLSVVGSGQFSETFCWLCGINRDREVAPTEKLNDPTDG